MMRFSVWFQDDFVTKLTDSKIAAPFSPIFPLGVRPNPPIRPAPKSLQTTQFTMICLEVSVIHLLERFMYKFPTVIQ